jgi:predicted type IV restriction endonuclease
MAGISARVEERIAKGVVKFQKILRTARDRDLNESDTVAIIGDMLCEIFGYDKYAEITSELAIKGTYCDLAIKVNEAFQFLIECKSIGTDLKETHLKQVRDYGANKGISWVILTNGLEWRIFKIKFEQPVEAEPVCSFNMDTLSPKKDSDIEKLFIICKEGLAKDTREEFYGKSQTINKYVIGALLLQEPLLSAIRRELRKLSVGTKIELEDIHSILETEVLKRDIVEGEEAEKRRQKIKRFYQKQNRENNNKASKSENAHANKEEEPMPEEIPPQQQEEEPLQ